MSGKIKQTVSGVSGKRSKQEKCSAAAAGREDTDPRVCGLLDAVRRGWYQLETGEIFGGFKVTREDVVLDVGCGEGNAVLFCAKQGAHVVFSDVDAAKIEALKEKVRQSPARKIECFVSDSVSLPLPDGYATKILSTEMLEHTVNPEKVLAELFRVGQTGAQYLITVPDSRSEMLQKPVAHPFYFLEPNHIQIFTKEEFIRLVENAGLKVERYDTWGFYWTVFMSLFWIVNSHEDFDGALLDLIKPPYHPVLQNWSNTWAGLMKLKGADKLMESFDSFLPKTQVIIARKE